MSKVRAPWGRLTSPGAKQSNDDVKPVGFDMLGHGEMPLPGNLDIFLLPSCQRFAEYLDIFAVKMSRY